METLAFRLPQFSEDLAWLPCWVQHQVEQFDECANEGSLKLDSKVSTLFQGDDFAGNDVVMLSMEESKLYKDCHRLLLSGGDDSLSSFRPSSTKVLQFRLRLSSNGFSQSTTSQLMASGTSPTFSEANKVLAMDKFETTKEKTSFKTGLTDGGLKILPQSSIPEQCPHHQPKSKVSMRRDRDVEINDAVELSISASEALVINGIVTNKPDSEALVATDALEVSLQVKKARLEWVEGDAFDFSAEIDETNSLSDLDDFTMTDAFEDVGLICGSYDKLVSDSAISCVKETPANENHYECEIHPGSVNIPAQQLNFDCTRNKSEGFLNSQATLRKYLPVESHSSESQRELHVDLVFSSSATNVERGNDHSTLKDPSTTDMAQVVGRATEDLISSRHQVEENIIISDSRLNNTREDTTTYPILERFRSRWLGGWTVKNNPKTILKAFTCETSFLSESADIAPDENSFVQIHKIKPNAESQSSIAAEVLPDKACSEILFTQDGVRCSSSSLLDPLCSVVPCSISVEDTNYTEAQKHDNIETDLQLDLGPIVERDISHLDAEIQCDEQIMPIVSTGIEGTVRKHMTSLKTYSTLFPGTVARSDERTLRYNRSFQSQYGCGQYTVNQNMGSEHLLLLTSAAKCFPLSQSEGLCKLAPSRNPTEQLKRKNASGVDDSAMGCHSFHTPKKCMKPCILNHTVRRRFQAHKPSNVDSFEGEHHNQDGVIDDAIRLQQIEKHRNTQSIYENSHQTNSRGRKRVCFANPEVQNKPNKNTLELNSCGNLWKQSMFKGMQFLLTGLSSRKGKDIEEQIQKHGGVVLPDIPSLNLRGSRCSRSYWYQLPIILSTRKQRTAKFLYGCAVNTFVLHVDWITDSIRAGSTLPLGKYLILPWQVALGSCIMKQVNCENVTSIFEKVGIMLHGKHTFYTKLERVVKHGGGRVFKSLQRLVECLEKKKISVGAIVTENDNESSRHLRQCASEWKIPMMLVPESIFLENQSAEEINLLLSELLVRLIMEFPWA